jgi:diguanylate cyclase (GGDEF)-like protein
LFWYLSHFAVQLVFSNSTLSDDVVSVSVADEQIVPAYVLIAAPNTSRAAALRKAVTSAVASETVLVRDGEEVLREIARRGAPPALLIADLSLPRVDGFSVIRRIRRQSEADQVHIVAAASFEPLRAAARALADQLSISAVMDLNADEETLSEVLAPELERLRRLRGAAPVPQAAERPAPLVPPTAPAPAPTKAVGTPVTPAGLSTLVGDLIDRAAIEARRRFDMPLGIAYSRVGSQESLSFHVGVQDAGPAVAIGEVTEFRFLRQVADSGTPLVVPDVEYHTVFAQLLLNGPRPIRGFAAVCVPTSRADIHAALCVLDTRPLSLGPAAIANLNAYGREVGQQVERALSPSPAAGERRPSDAAVVNIDEVRVLQQLAATDPLTGLSNRRGGEGHIAREISRARREHRPLCCILIDIDRFKDVNDTFGHQAGDQLLKETSDLLRRAVRAYDILVRWGGEEFLVVLPGVDLPIARALAERIRAAMEALDTHGMGPVTISAGVAKFEQDYDFAATLRTADQRLYQAKSAGRNRVV